MSPTDIPITPVRREKPGAFSIEIDPEITDPASVRTSFLILLDGDLVMSPEHLGVAFMASVLREAGFTCEIREVRHGLDEERTIAELVEYDPALVCFTLMSLNVVSAAALSERLAEALPDAVIACGGPAGTFAGTEVLRRIPHADVVAVGEGEPTILDLVQRIALGDDLSDCPGICYRDARGRPRQNPTRPLVHDLDALPHPARDQLVSHGNELEYVRVSTSRGCVARCTFCAAPHTNNRVQQGKAWRGRSPERVVDEIVQLVRNHRFRTFDFIDSTFEDPDGGRLGKERVRRIAQGILDEGLDIYFNVCMRAENWKDTPEDHALLDLLVRAGLEKANVGIESGVPEELLLWEKKATVQDNVTVIRMLEQHGIYLAMGFIPFHPYATVETILENAEFLRHNAGHNLRRMTERLEIYPGTKIVRRMTDDGLLTDAYLNELDPYGYTYQDERVEVLATHFASLYNNDDYHRRGVITEQSSVFEFETFNVVLQTFISRLHRRFHHVPEAMERIETFKERIRAIRQEMSQHNVDFFRSNVDDALSGRLDHDKRAAQVLDVERYFDARIDQMKTEQLRLGKHLHRMGLRVAEISSTLPDPAPGGAQRSYTGEGAGATW
ncbi:radical SAM protein [Nocardiopsis akebiae]|uniref:Radical SAM protein n=1 Tax=Nocardiopsis akebiae TaxID=2831968 RepID=A0ABX8BXK6_9ACTN|nr:radical SAM protein [Nocardiopsis akebiae]QUX26930.1 radical SAM protein [Nocardiopsis akebiae]